MPDRQATAMSLADARLPCIGVVLAGGRSTRMGRDKAMLAWQGRPLLDRQIDVLRRCGVDAWQISGDRPDYGSVADMQAGLGPLGGLVSVAGAVSGDADLLVIPVDMPLLGPDLLRRLRLAHAQARCLRYAGHVMPMRLRLDATSREQLAALLDQAEPAQRSLRALQRAMDAVELPLDDSEAAQLLDCNTEASWNEVTR
ncbi:molybdenum cofactor guanylyltransferase [Dyella sp. A6]|uniref:molybdenum cofactor guanylyltransferase n=1 Tax=Dyella aluminiiresistens TaxID=3069105 RepID=UPI002E798B3B|nr:molybdenum cofactor guanylyltransferase [Dyella sp. A6]